MQTGSDVIYEEVNAKAYIRGLKDGEEIGRTKAIDKFLIDTLDKIEFEEKWLMKAKSDNADTNVMFSCLKTFCKERAKQLKEQND